MKRKSITKGMLLLLCLGSVMSPKLVNAKEFKKPGFEANVERRWVTGVYQRFKDDGRRPPSYMYYGHPSSYAGYLKHYHTEFRDGYIYCYYEGYIYKGGHYAPTSVTVNLDK